MQAFIVAGGEADDFYPYQSSVLILLPGAAAWTPIASLPHTLIRARASVVGGRMRVTGGWSFDWSQKGLAYRSEVKIDHSYRISNRQKVDLGNDDE